MNADSFYDIRNNLNGGVEENNLVKFLELQKLNFYIIVAQNRKVTN